MEAGNGAPVLDASAWALSCSLPLDIIQNILECLYTVLHFRFSLASKTCYTCILPRASIFYFYPTHHDTDGYVGRQLRWTNSLPGRCKLKCLTVLYLQGPADVDAVARLVRSAPNLRVLDFCPWQRSTPLACNDSLPLCLALRNHPTLRRLVLRRVDLKTFRLGPFLPPGLEELAVTDLKGKIEDDGEEFWSDIAAKSPKLSLLSVYAEESVFMSIGAICLLTNLTSLTMISDSGPGSWLVPDSAAQCRALLGTWEIILPKPKGGRWKLLEFGSPEHEGWFMRFPYDLPLLRDLVQTQRVFPTVSSLNSFDSFDMSDEAQLAFYKFVLEECQASVPDCDCLPPATACESCGWFTKALSLRPNASRYVIEQYFLPFVAAKAERLGESPAFFATPLLLSFNAPQLEASVINYVQNVECPLDMKVGPTPTFLLLEYQSARQALLARAEAIGASLGLNCLLDVVDLGPCSPDALLHAAQVEPAFFLSHLAYLVECGANELIMELAATCPLDVPKRLEHLKECTWLFQREKEVALLFAALGALLTEAGVVSFVNEIALKQVFFPPVMQWVLTSGIDLSRSRSADGKNWLHVQLPFLLRYCESQPFDPYLLAEVTISGDTPLHCLCAHWAKPWIHQVDTELKALAPYMAFIDQRGLWKLKNSSGFTSLELIEPQRGVPEALRALVERHCPHLLK